MESSAAVALTSALPRLLEAEPSGRTLGIQLYTVAADLAADLPGTLAALRKIGYKVVESAGFASLSAKDFRKALDDAGLRCPSSHLHFTATDPAPLFEDAHVIGAHYVVSSMLIAPPAGVSGNGHGAPLASLTLDDFKRTADLANQIGAKAKQAGLQYAYHNHNFEFRDQGNGQTGYDLLLKETDPELVKFELDCGWMVAAGFSPVNYFQNNPNRYRMIHVKDFLLTPKPTTDLQGPDRPKGTELGKGHIDYKPIFAAASHAGVEYFFSEQEPPVVGMTELEAAKVNFDYMRAL
ncbi:MAG: sugar phosphate isomerase/epimerase [Terracidiphilus sp.]|jgi:sugar phosphate isomerase/epimerase